MAKKKMFKQLAVTHVESIGTEGNWNSFLRIEKQQAAMVAAYADKARISFNLNSDLDTARAGGYLFAATNSTDDPTDGQIISASAIGRLGGGVVSLDLKRLIRRNEDDNESGEGYIYLWVRSTDMSTGNTLSLDIVAEVWGRWHSIVAL